MNETIPVVWSLCKIMPAYKKVSNVIINVITKPPIPAISQVTGSIGVSRIDTTLQKFENAVFTWKDNNNVTANLLPFFELNNQTSISVSGLTNSTFT